MTSLIIYTPSGPRVVVAMTWDAYEADAYAFIANVGSIVYSTILEPPANARYEVPRTTLSVDVGSSPRITIPITNAGSDAWNGSGVGSYRLIWEMRDSQRHFVHSKAMCWVAIDRGIRLAEDTGRPAPLERWRALRDEIHGTVTALGVDRARGCFVQAFGSNDLDAAVLRLPAVGFVAWERHRFSSRTTRRCQRRARPPTRSR